MKQGLLFKKSSTCKTANIDYLDEKSDIKISFDVKFKNRTKEEAEKEREKLIKSVEYLTKEECGKVFAAGFLRDRLLSMGDTAPETWDNETRKKRIQSALEKHRRDFGLYRNGMAHKLIFSMDAELHKQIVDKGLCPDKILVERMKKVMKKFQDEFHPGDRIGYAFGLHHDTDNLHIHVYLSNRTESGKHVAVSCPLKDKWHSKVQKNQIEFIKKELYKTEYHLSKCLEKEETNKLTIAEHGLKRESVKPPRKPVTDNRELIELQNLHSQYNKLIEMQKELDKKVNFVSNSMLYKADVPKIIRNLNTLLIGKNIKKRKQKLDEFYSLKRKYMFNLKGYMFRDFIKNSPQQVRNQYFKVLRIQKDKKAAGLNIDEEKKYLLALRNQSNSAFTAYSRGENINRNQQTYKLGA